MSRSGIGLLTFGRKFFGIETEWSEQMNPQHAGYTGRQWDGDDNSQDDGDNVGPGGICIENQVDEQADSGDRGHIESIIEIHGTPEETGFRFVFGATMRAIFMRFNKFGGECKQPKSEDWAFAARWTAPPKDRIQLGGCLGGVKDLSFRHIASR